MVNQTIKYFRITDDLTVEGRWYLGKVEGVDNWSLAKKKPKYVENANLNLINDGIELDYTHTEIYGLPVVSKVLAEYFSEFEGVELLRVNIEKKSKLNEYFVLSVTNEIDCVDEDKSIFTRFEDNDPVRPDKSGQYRAFMNLIIDSRKVKNANIFRLSKFTNALIVSSQVKDRVEEIAAKGCKFHCVV